MQHDKPYCHADTFDCIRILLQPIAGFPGQKSGIYINMKDNGIRHGDSFPGMGLLVFLSTEYSIKIKFMKYKIKYIKPIDILGNE